MYKPISFNFLPVGLYTFYLVTSIKFLLSIVVSLPCTFFRSSAFGCCFIFLLTIHAFSQPDTVKVPVAHLARIDTIRGVKPAEKEDIVRLASIDTIKVQPAIEKTTVVRIARIDTINVSAKATWDSTSMLPFADHSPIDPATKRKRIILNTSLHAGLYAASMVILNQAWYADYPRSNFHTYNDSKEWLQVDKVGHTWTAYQISRMSMARCRFSNCDRSAGWF